MEDEKLKKLKEVLLLVNDGLTQKSFDTSIKAVLDLISKMYKVVSDAVAELKKTSSALIQKNKDDYDSNVSDIRNEVKDKLAQVKNGVDGREGKNGKDGKDADEEKITQEVLSKIEIPKIEDVEKDLPKLGEQIRDGLELLQNDERLDMKAIKDLDKKLEELNKKASQIRSGGNLGMKKIVYIRSEDLSSQVDGTNKAFTLPKKTLKVVAVMGSQWPTILRETIDWTFAGGTLTLTSAVTAPQATQTLICLIEVGFYY